MKKLDWQKFQATLTPSQLGVLQEFCREQADKLENVGYLYGCSCGTCRYCTEPDKYSETEIPMDCECDNCRAKRKLREVVKALREAGGKQ